jgi:hypothetical protein
MPSFKDSKNSALNPELAIKKEVVRLQKEANKTGEIVPTSAVAGPQISSPSRAGGMAEVMNSLDTLTAEVVSTISFYTVAGIRAVDEMVGNDTSGIQKTRDAVADLSPNSSAMVSLIKKGQGILASANYDLTNKISRIEVDTIASDVKGCIKSERELIRLKRRVDRFLRQNINADGRVAFLELWNGISRLSDRWEPALLKFLEDVDMSIQRAKQGVSATATGAGYSGGLMPSHFAVTSPSLPRRFI